MTIHCQSHITISLLPVKCDHVRVDGSIHHDCGTVPVMVFGSAMNTIAE